MIKISTALLSLTMFFLWGNSKEENYRLGKAFHETRRELIRSNLPSNGVLFVYSKSAQKESSEIRSQFLQDANYYYLTGVDKGDGILVLLKKPIEIDHSFVDEILFVPYRDSLSERWKGERYNTRDYQNLSGIDYLLPLADFERFLSIIEYEDLQFYSYFPNNFLQTINGDNDLRKLTNTMMRTSNSMGRDLNTTKAKGWLAKAREIKTLDELDMIGEAVDITVQAFNGAMKKILPGMMEYQIQAILEYHILYEGAFGVPFPLTVASGKNAGIMHYSLNRKRLEEGELLIVDAGVNYGYYTSDVARTFPVDGKFNNEQKEVYEIVLKAQKRGIQLCTKDRSLNHIKDSISRYLAIGLRSLGIIDQLSEVGKYTLHSPIHHLGLDNNDLNTQGRLKSGMVLSVEPGIYIPKGSKCDPKYWGIFVRIEDNIVITDLNPTVLSLEIPKEIKDIEVALKRK